MIHGQANIKVFDADGNVVQDLTDNNMVTKAGEHFLNPDPAWGGDSPEIINMRSRTYVRRDIFSGILLFADQITEDENNIFIPSGVKCIGGAGQAYSGENKYRGTLNTNESGWSEDHKSYKFVYDFATDKCNGIIKSIALTSECGGNAAPVETFQGVNRFPIMAELHCAPDFYNGLLHTSNDSEYCDGQMLNIKDKIGHITDKSFSYYQEIIYGDTTSDIPNYYHVCGNFADRVLTFAKTTAGSTGIDIINRSYSKKAQLYGPALYTDKTTHIDTTAKMGRWCQISCDENYLYSIYPYSTNKIDYCKIDAINGTVVEQKTLTVQGATFNMNEFAKTACYKNNLYIISSDYAVYKIDMTGVIQETLPKVLTSSGGAYYPGVTLLGNHLLIFACSWKSGEQQFNSNPIGAYLYDGENVQYVDMRYQFYGFGGPLAVIPSKFVKAPYVLTSVSDDYNEKGVVICIYSAFLSTINNLSADVVKTNVQTMKVTYTLTEV